MGAEAPVARIIPWEAVSSVVASHRILRRVVLTENGGGTLTETAPVLHILFEQDGRRRIAGVPFATHQDPAVDTWITELRRHGMALGCTARLLSWKDEDQLSEDARLACFATTEEVVDLPPTGGWLDNTLRGALPAAVVFFLPLPRGLRWYHGPVCRLLLVVVAFAVVVGTVEIGPAAEEMVLTGFGLTLVSAGLLWAPYLLVKRSVPRDDFVGSAGSRYFPGDARTPPRPGRPGAGSAHWGVEESAA